MKKRSLISLVLTGAMVLSLAACGGEKAPVIVDNGDTGANNAPTIIGNGDVAQTITPSDKKLTEINLGSWWVIPYDSDDTLEETPDWLSNQDKEGDTEKDLQEKAIRREIEMLKFNNVKKLEDKYGLKFFWQNLTYEGTKDSINTSIIAGTPDCEIYMVNSGMAIPAQANGLALDLKTVLPADHDLFTDQNVMSYLDLGDGKACILIRQNAENIVGNTYPLGFNVEMLQEAGLEDPRDLAARGEWTWDKFVEYCQALTKDTDGDGQTDQYGLGGFSKDIFQQLLFSNGASIAVGTEQTLDAPSTIESIEYLQDLFVKYNVCYPYDFDGSPWDSMRIAFLTGQVGFWPAACWIMANNNSYFESETPLAFDTAFVTWPIGPSGDYATNKMKNFDGVNYFIIPANVAEPEKVVNFLYDLWDYTEGDIAKRDNPILMNWWFVSTSNNPENQQRNYDVMYDMGSRGSLDIWDSVGIEMDFNGLLRGDITPAQMAETYKQEYQSALDALYK